MWFLIPAALLLLLLLYLLSAPLVIEIDTRVGLFKARFHYVAGAALHLENSDITLTWNILSWSRRINLVEKLLSPPKQRQKKETAHKRRPKAGFPAALVKAVLKSFRVRQFFWTVDTGNMMLNGILYPLFHYLHSHTGKNISINFSGENILALEIRNNAFRLLRAYIRNRHF